MLAVVCYKEYDDTYQSCSTW